MSATEYRCDRCGKVLPSRDYAVCPACRVQFSGVRDVSAAPAYPLPSTLDRMNAARDSRRYRVEAGEKQYQRLKAHRDSRFVRLWRQRIGADAWFAFAIAVLGSCLISLVTMATWHGNWFWTHPSWGAVAAAGVAVGFVALSAAVSAILPPRYDDYDFGCYTAPRGWPYAVFMGLLSFSLILAYLLTGTGLLLPAFQDPVASLSQPKAWICLVLAVLGGAAFVALFKAYGQNCWRDKAEYFERPGCILKEVGVEVYFNSEKPPGATVRLLGENSLLSTLQQDLSLIAELTRVQELWLGQVKLSQQALETMASIPGIEVLQFDKTNFQTREPTRYFTQETLREIRVKESNLSLAELRTFKAAHPGIKITYQEKEYGSPAVVL